MIVAGGVNQENTCRMVYQVTSLIGFIGNLYVQDAKLFGEHTQLFTATSNTYELPVEIGNETGQFFRCISLWVNRNKYKMQRCTQITKLLGHAV